MVLDDNSPYPFGVHKGKAMANVPADYLLWARKQGWNSVNARAVYAYIDDNLDVLKKEIKNG